MAYIHGTEKLSTHSILVDGEIVGNVPDSSIYVSSESELANATDMPVGTFDIQYGFTHLWQLKPDKTWVEI